MTAIGFFHAFLWLAILPIMKNWFTGKNGLVMSVWMTNWNVGSLIAVRISHIVILQNNLKWEIVFYVITAISYGLGLICLLFLYTNPDETKKLTMANSVPAAI